MNIPQVSVVAKLSGLGAWVEIFMYKTRNPKKQTGMIVNSATRK